MVHHACTLNIIYFYHDVPCMSLFFKGENDSLCMYYVTAFFTMLYFGKSISFTMIYLVTAFLLQRSTLSQHFLYHNLPCMNHVTAFLFYHDLTCLHHTSQQEIKQTCLKKVCIIFGMIYRKNERITVSQYSPTCLKMSPSFLQ